MGRGAGWMLWPAVLVCLSCASDDAVVGAPADSCESGELRECPCPGSGLGAQACRSDGRSFGACQGCPEASSGSDATVPGDAGTRGPASGGGGSDSADDPNQTQPSDPAGDTSGPGASEPPSGGEPDGGSGDEPPPETPTDGDTSDDELLLADDMSTREGVSCGVGLPALCDLDTEKCCVRSLDTDSCIGAEQSCECALGQCDVMEATCDGPEDCPEGQVCCGTFSSGFNGLRYTNISCSSSCNDFASQRHMCHQDRDTCESGLVCANSQLLTNIQVCIDPASIEQ